MYIVFKIEQTTPCEILIILSIIMLYLINTFIIFQ